VLRLSSKTVHYVTNNQLKYIDPSGNMRPEDYENLSPEAIAQLEALDEKYWANGGTTSSPGYEELAAQAAAIRGDPTNQKGYKPPEPPKPPVPPAKPPANPSPASQDWWSQGELQPLSVACIVPQLPRRWQPEYEHYYTRR
jgi:hypothetical protein